MLTLPIVYFPDTATWTMLPFSKTHDDNLRRSHLMNCGSCNVTVTPRRPTTCIFSAYSRYSLRFKHSFSPLMRRHAAAKTSIRADAAESPLGRWSECGATSLCSMPPYLRYPLAHCRNLPHRLGSCELHTFWYDDNVLNGSGMIRGSLVVDRFNSTVASLGPSHQHL